MISITGILLFLHVVFAVSLVIVVLLQSQQSMNLSGLMGGASQSAMGSKPKTVLSKVTTVLAILFFLTGVIFAMMPREEGGALSPDEVSSQPAGGGQAPAQDANGGPAPAPAPEESGGGQSPTPGEAGGE